MTEPVITVTHFRDDIYEWLVVIEGVVDATALADGEKAAQAAAEAWLDRWIAST